MKIYTGNFANLRKYIANGLFPISIARYNPYYSGATLKELAPPSWLINYPEAEYKPLYQEQLNGLEKEVIFKRLRDISGGRDVVLLCYEASGKFCHRHLVAEWLSKVTEVAEFQCRNIQTEMAF